MDGVTNKTQFAMKNMGIRKTEKQQIHSKKMLKKFGRKNKKTSKQKKHWSR